MYDARPDMVMASVPVSALTPVTPMPAYGTLPGQAQPWGASGGLHALWGVIRRNLVFIVACAVVTVMLVAMYSLWTTPVYEVTSLLNVDEKRSPLPDVFESLSMQENAVSTEMEMLQSRTLAEDVVRAHGLQLHLTSPRKVPRSAVLNDIKVDDDAPAAVYRLTRRSGKSFAVEDRKRGKQLGEVAPGAHIHLPGVSFTLAPAVADSGWSHVDLTIAGLEAEVSQFRKQLKVDRPVRDANTISIAYRGTDPALMRDVLNDLTSRFISGRQDVEKSEASSAVHFLNRELSTVSNQLSATEDSVRNYREQQQVVAPEEQEKSQVDRLVSAQADRNALDAERASLAQLVHDAEQGDPNDSATVTRYRQLIASPSLLKNTASDGLLQSLTTLEDQRATLLTRRTTRDPEVQALTARIDAVDNEIHTVAVTYLQGLDKQVSALDETLQGYKGQLQNLPQKELGYARLERSEHVLDDTYVLLQTRLKDAQIAQAVEDPSVRVVDEAVIPDRPLRPNLPLNLGAGLLLGVTFGVGIAFLRHGRDPSVRTRADIQGVAGLPVIGLIPSARAIRRMTRKNAVRDRLGLSLPAARREVSPVLAQPVSELDSPLEMSAILTDAYARLETNLAQLSPTHQGRIFLVTSPMAGEGKTTNAVNLALILAKRGHRVLLVDADMRNSRMDTLLSERPGWGLSDVLSTRVSVDIALRHLERGDGASFDYLSSGTQRLTSATLLSPARLKAFFDDVRPLYDVVIVDTPPLVVPDAVIVSQLTDGVLVVVRAGATARAALGYAVQQLRVVAAPIIGAVLNDIDFLRDETYDAAFGYYGAAYAYGYATANVTPST